MFDFFKRKNKKKNYEMQTVEMNRLMDFLGLSGVSNDRLSEVTYFTCMKVLSEGLAKLPLALQKVSDDGGIIDMTGSSLWQTVKVRPNPYMSPSTFWAAMENNRNHFGNAYSLIDRNTYSGNVKLWVLDSSSVKIEIENGKDLSELEDITYVYTSPNSGQTIRIPSENILHFKTSTVFIGLVGLSVREKLALSLDGAVMSQEMLNNLYKNNFIPKAAVQFEAGAMINETYEAAYLKTLQDYADGNGDGGKTFIPVAPGTSIVPLNIRLTDGQFLELRKYTALQIAAAFGIKPNHLNDYEKSSYANSETQQLAFYTDTMLYILKQYEEELNYKLLSQEQRESGFRFKFNIAAVLRGDTKSQLESLSMGVSNGVYTPNEARRNLDLPSKPGGDRIYFNGSNIAVEDAGMQYEKAPEKEFETMCNAVIKAAENSFLPLAKHLESAIININKYSDSQPRDDHGRWTDGGGGSSGGSGGTARDSGSGDIKITDAAIEKVSKIDVFDDEEKNKRYQQANKDLLKEAQKQPVGTEVSIIYDKNMNPIKDHGYVVGEKGKVKIDSYDKPYHAFHNHPSGETFSPDDLIQLSQRNNQMSVTAVENNGSLYCVSKTGNANSAGYKQFIYDQCRQKRFLGKYSYFTVSSKSFDKSKLSESEIDKLGNQLSSFCERCAKGGVFYGFNYRKKRIH